MLLLFGTFVLTTGFLIVTSVRRSMLAPIDRLCARLSEVTPHDGSTPVRFEAEGELVQVADRVNEMLSRIRRSESDLIRTERVRVAGDLAAGVSHNLNNILTGILGPSEYLEQNVQDQKLLIEASRIHRAAIKARDLVARFS